MQITERLFTAFVRCKYKAKLLADGETGIVCDYARLETDLDNEHRQRSLQTLAQQYGLNQIADSPSVLSGATARGWRLIVNPTVAHGNFTVTFHALEQSSYAGKANGHQYVPLLFVYREQLSLHDKLLAAFFASVLADIQGTPATYAKIIHGRNGVATKVQMVSTGTSTGVHKHARSQMDALATQLAGGVSPPLTLNDHCNLCEFKMRCHAAAVEKDDLSLLPRMSAAEIARFRDRGICTVTQLSHTFRAKSVTRHKPNSPMKYQPALHATALRENKVFVARQPTIRTAATRIFLDIEGIPDRGFYYLLGLVVEEGVAVRTHWFWADGRENEESLWHNLLHILADIGCFVLYHYGRYEGRFFGQMQQRYGVPPGKESTARRLETSSVNVLAEISQGVYFPTYSQSLKVVGPLVGATWSAEDASGRQSIVWRHRWEVTRDPEVKTTLIKYNEEDCFALRKLTDALIAMSERSLECGLNVVNPEDMPAPNGHRFGKHSVATPEIRKIIRCAYFDYQTNKVFFRTDKSVRASVHRKHKRSGRMPRPNEVIECRRPPSCPRCGSRQLRSNGRWTAAKTINDLRFTRAGIKRWIVRYVTRRFRCDSCATTIYSDEYPKGRSKYGHSLSSWAVHAHVALRHSFEDVTNAANDFFGYSFSFATLKRIKPRMAQIYEAAQLELLTRLKSGQVLHADEAKVSVKGRDGYVWTFTNMQEVVYLFNPARDGTVLTKVIDGFNGVLVSDFYGVYDSAGCPQQKCVIHFIRDLNDDLMKYPFDAELSSVARAFTQVFTPIVETIDRYGLTRRHLNPHRHSAERFLQQVAKATYNSTPAQGYQRRLAKYGERMFTFLSYDGVSWNNNAAENAIKLLVSRRRVIEGVSTETGLGQYLVFLSLFCTLRRKGASLLRFLLSGKVSIEEFLADA